MQVASNFMQVLPCKHCGKTGYHLWSGSGICPGLTEGVNELHGGTMPESMAYYQMGFKAGWDMAVKELRPKTPPVTKEEME